MSDTSQSLTSLQKVPLYLSASSALNILDALLDCGIVGNMLVTATKGSLRIEAMLEQCL